jgi:excinuclease ABC subunit C
MNILKKTQFGKQVKSEEGYSSHKCVHIQDISKIPHNPGVYLFKNKQNIIIYVGKAIDLKKRVSSYFKNSKNLAIKTQKLVENIDVIDYILTDNEEEALIKENELIKKYQPKYNIVLRDDKSYPYIEITILEDCPKIFFTRKPCFIISGKAKQSLFFGPYPNVYDAKKIINYVIKEYKLRECKYDLTKKRVKPCLNFQIGKCNAPCVGNISNQEYKKQIDKAIAFLKGKQKQIIKKLSQTMQEYSDNLEFEKAGEIRDILKGANQINKVAFIKKQINIENVLIELKQKLNLKNKPYRIEAFDISNISGKDAVGAMVVFVNGKPVKKFYKKFRIKGVTKIDDFAMIKEVVSRCYSKLKEKGEELPDLILIDGGKGQVSSAVMALKKLDINFPDIIGLAKKLELIYIYNKKEPVILNKYSDELQLLQRIRDEVHRFVITYHKKIRSKRTINSVLLNINGIKEKKALELIKYFGSVENIKKALNDELKQVKGISKNTAEDIVEFFKKHGNKRN